MKIALIEGLWSYEKGYVRRTYAGYLKREGHIVTSYPYGSRLPSDIDVIIAHSFGAGYVMHHDNVFDNPILLITMDAREWKFWRNWKYIPPYFAAKHVNFYQTGLFRGHPIRNAFQNFNLTGRIKRRPGIAPQHIRLVSAAFQEVTEHIEHFEKWKRLSHDY